MATVDVDVRDLDRLISDLRAVATAVPKAAKGIVSKGALNIKTAARDAVTGFAHLPHYPNAINYTIRSTGGDITAEIGPDKTKKQGEFGAIVEFGTPNSGPHPHLLPAITDEEPRFVRAMGDLAAGVLGT